MNMKECVLDLKSALQFSTILPVGAGNVFRPVGQVAMFPVVGLILGGILAFVDAVLSNIWPPMVVGILDTVLLMVLTGGFHLDGLGDTADGLFSHRPKERALEIMKDSRSGAMGVLAMIAILAMKWAGLASMSAPGWSRALLLIAIPALARGSQIFGIGLLPYGRKEGTAHDLFGDVPLATRLRFMIAPVLLVLCTGGRGVMVLLVYTGITAVLLAWYKKKMGGITGDMLGAMTEITEGFLFVAAAAAL
ncbi:adenosylcobinamide-GDP ribazoletransferase [Desulfoluna spongiiphila]|uniref:Adenosylcobinamide-GDP ribazoletransferase n=1 Tax=Desulfoluna spongiiphila TaxID=419481 RepID=A0A1G5JE37_9BACT|nr:adenosylcobinamide-GDP ribazoletransferase [Desulfoluna spongiiphila]SCY85968.1 cobalamin-5'-phosphate synthase [Desulfoluna spongiiphila]